MSNSSKILYGIVIDADTGASEDFNFNYISSDSIELYFTKEERDERLKFLDGMCEKIEEFGEGEISDFLAIQFEATLGCPSLIPRVVKEEFNDLFATIEEDPDSPGTLKMSWDDE